MRAATTKRGQSGRVHLLPEPKKRKYRHRTDPEPTHRPKQPKAKTLADYLAAEGGEGTDLERIIRNAAKRLGFRFDAEQWLVQLVVNGSYTVIDFVTFNPKRAVYPQGWQHYERLESYQKDVLQDMELRDNGWFVFRPSYLEIYRDPMLVMQNIIMCLEQPTRRDP
jgi:very-short-patch-repair endonuclease